MNITQQERVVSQAYTSTIYKDGICGRIENPSVKNGIVIVRESKLGYWTSVFRLDGQVACRTADTKELAVYKSFIAAKGKANEY